MAPKKPVTVKNPSKGQNENLSFGFSSMQGYREEMEDRHHATLSIPGKQFKEWSFFGVFDGHAGSQVSQYAADHLLEDLLEHIGETEVSSNPKFRKEIEEGFLEFDDDMRKDLGTDEGFDDSGSTAICVFVNETHFHFVNLGDSRGLLYRNGAVHFSTKDHKPDDEDEEKRITSAGGDVTYHKSEECYRINNGLALSRAFGDYSYKENSKKTQTSQMVIPQPDVTSIMRNSRQDEFLALACDGVMDVMSNDELAKFIHNKIVIEGVKGLDEVCNNVLDHCLEKGSADNMSIIIVKLPGCPDFSGGGKQDERRGNGKRKNKNKQKSFQKQAKKQKKTESSTETDDDDEVEDDEDEDDDDSDSEIDLYALALRALEDVVVSEEDVGDSRTSADYKNENGMSSKTNNKSTGDGEGDQ